MVSDARGHPVAGAAVQAQIDASHAGRFAVIATALTDKGGRYRIVLPTDMGYFVSARAPDGGVAEIRLSQSKLVQERDKMKDLNLKAANRAVRGVVNDRQGNPVAGAVVMARISGGMHFPSSAVTDDRGRFSLEHLNDDPSIYMSVKAPGRGWIGDRTIGPGDHDVTVTVAPSHWD